MTTSFFLSCGLAATSVKDEHEYQAEFPNSWTKWWSLFQTVVLFSVVMGLAY